MSGDEPTPKCVKVTTRTLSDILRQFNAEYSLGMNRVTLTILEANIKEHIYNVL